MLPEKATGRNDLPESDRKRDPSKASNAASGEVDTGISLYVAFEKQVGDLDKELRMLCSEVRKLGSSGGILSAATSLRQRLGRVLHLFRANATELYPAQMQAHVAKSPAPVKPLRLWKPKGRIALIVRDRSVDDAPDSLELELRMLANGIESLLDCFTQFPRFVEELPDWSFAEDLSGWTESLPEEADPIRKTQFIRQYIHESMTNIGNHLEPLTQHFIPPFVRFGIPTERASQDRQYSNLQNQTIVATLFSAITASMIQIWSSGRISNHKTLNDLVSVFWYMALVFSISSAVNSLLGLSWAQAVFRSPICRVPWWVLIWMKRFPLVSLVLSVACFFVGLILFVYASLQSRITTTVTALLSSLSCVGLVAMCGWFSCELLVYTRYGGRKWLADVIDDAKSETLGLMSNGWSASAKER